MSFCHLITIHFPLHKKCSASAEHRCVSSILFSVWQGHILLSCSVHPPHSPNQDGYRCCTSSWTWSLPLPNKHLSVSIIFIIFPIYYTQKRRSCPHRDSFLSLMLFYFICLYPYSSSIEIKNLRFAFSISLNSSHSTTCLLVSLYQLYFW